MEEFFVVLTEEKLKFPSNPVHILRTIKRTAKSLDIHDMSTSFWTSLMN